MTQNTLPQQQQKQRAPVKQPRFAEAFWLTKHPYPVRYHEGLEKTVGVGWEKHHFYMCARTGKIKICQESFKPLTGASFGIRGKGGKGCVPEILDYEQAKSVCEKSMKTKRPVAEVFMEMFNTNEMLPAFVRELRKAPAVIIVRKMPVEPDYMES